MKYEYEWKLLRHAGLSSVGSLHYCFHIDSVVDHVGGFIHKYP